MKAYTGYSVKLAVALVATLLFLYPCFSRGEEVSLPEADQFEFILPDVVMAQVPFAVKITAKDQLGNPIVNYDEVGKNLEIKVIGKGKIIPDLVLASRFQYGVAKVDFVYDTIESFTMVISVGVGPKAEPKIIVRRIVKAIKRQQGEQVREDKAEVVAQGYYVQELDSLRKRLEQTLRDKFALEKKLIDSNRALEEKENENLVLEKKLTELLAEMKGQLLDTKEFISQTREEVGQLRSKFSLSGEDVFTEEQGKGMEFPEIPLEGQKDAAEQKWSLPLLSAQAIKVFMVDEGLIALPVGKKDGLEKGTQFTVYDQQERPLAVIEISELYEDISLANVSKTIGASGIKNGDIVHLR